MPSTNVPYGDPPVSSAVPYYSAAGNIEVPQYKGWQIVLDPSGSVHDAKILYNGEQVKYVQKVQLEIDVNATCPILKLEIAAIKGSVQVEGFAKNADLHVQTEVVCPDCKETRIVENKNW